MIPSDFKHVNEYYGLIKFKVLPPRDLYHPVYLLRLMENLCFHCAITCAQNIIKDCKHSEKERSFEGTWVTL